MRISKKTVYSIPGGNAVEIKKALDAVPETAHVEFAERGVTATVFHEDLIV